MKLKVSDNYKVIKEKIAAAAEKVGRSSAEIKLVAITKFADIELIKEAISQGILDLGENKIQMALPKVSQLKGSPIIWHFVGHLQTNKVCLAVENFQLIQSVDSLKLVKALDKEGRKLNKVVEILIEVNISGEERKYGIKPQELEDFLREVSSLKNVKVLGLMTMAPFYDDPEKTRPVFRKLKQLKEAIAQENIPGIEMKYLSMGMTNDFKVAIEEGSNMVRIGTGLFK